MRAHWSGGLGNPDFSDAFQTGAASLDLSGAIDLSAVEIDLSSLPPFDLGELMSGIQLNVSAEGMAQTAQKLMEGYQVYAAENPQADYSGLGEAFLNYLTTDDAKAILSKHIGEIIKNSGSVHVSVENMQAMQQELMSGYLEYVDRKRRRGKSGGQIYDGISADRGRFADHGKMVGSDF